MAMADGSSKGIGRIRRNKRREMQQRANHLLYLHLTGVAIADDSHFDFGRGVFVSGSTTQRCSYERRWSLKSTVIAKLNGTLALKTPGEVIVDVGGVGYQLFISLGVFYRLPEIGRSVNLFVHTHLREDALQLYGFLENEEKQVFNMLNGVTGIGPKLAISILSGIPSGDLVQAIRRSDQLRLVSIPGVGKKLAERMIVELKDKLETLPGTAY